jgi:hypothetical protein
MKEKWWLIGLATLAICGGVAVAIPTLQLPGPGVTKANFDRVEEGMDKEDVEAIFGRPGNRSGPFMGFFVERWTGEDGSKVDVDFVDRSVHSKHWYESTETITDKLRRWLSLPRK